MANVMFKRGTQANLNKLSTYVDGAFYLTTDTDRLYVAQSTSELVELNKSITTVATLTDLPTTGVAEGQFYYVSGSNILCYYNGTAAVAGQSAGWVQINPDTNDGNDYVSAFSIEKDTSNTDTSKLKYNWSITQADKSGNAVTGHALSGSFEIASSDVVALGGVAVDIDATAGSNSAVLGLGGSGADSTASAGKVTIAGGTNVTVAAADNTVTISAADTTYGLSSAANSTTINLKTSGNTAAGSVEIAGDGGYISVDGTTADQLVISHGVSGATAGTYGEAGKEVTHRASGDTVVDGMKISVPKITIDAKGHVTSASTETFTLPVDNDTTYTAVAATAASDAGNTGKLTIGINDGTNNSTATSGRILYNKITVDGTENTVYNTESLGSFYSASKVDTLLKGVNAMVYKGTLGSGATDTVAALPTANVSAGDTYKVTTAGTYASVAADVGDLFIATGTEGSDGYIPSASIVWSYVPSGDDTDTKYTLSAANNKISITDSVSSTAQNVTLADDDVVTLTSTGNTITAAHADVLTSATGTYGESASKTATHGGKITIPKVEVTAEGHIKTISDVEVTLPADNNTTYRLTGNNTAKSISLKDSGNNAVGSVTFAQGNALTVTMTGDDAATDDSAKEDKTVTIKHNDITRTDPTTAAAAQSAYGGKFTAVTGVTSDSQGHITGVATTEFQLPAEKATSVTADAANSKLTVNYNAAAVGSVQVKSDNLTVSSTASDNNLVTTINMVWGTF